MNRLLKEYPLIVKATFFILFVILFFYGLILAEDFLAPFCLGILFAYLIYPLASYLEKKRIHRILAILIAILFFLLAINGIMFIIIKQIQGLLHDFPTFKEKALENIDQLIKFIEINFGIEYQKQETWLKENVSALFETGSIFLKNTFSATTSTVFKLALLPVFIFYLLYYRDHFQEFILRVVPRDKEKVARLILKKTSVMTINYMGGVTIVVLILSILNSAGLYIVGLQYAATFGIISALFNFIPYFGNWIGASIPFVFAILTGSSPNLALGVVILYVIVQFIEHNILTPNITGGYVNLNPLFTIISIIIAGMVWGLIGMFIVIPFMATIKIVFNCIIQ